MRWSFLVLVAVACGARQQLPPPGLDPPAFRLPREVRPAAYAVDLTLTPGEPRFTGTVDIDVELAVPTRVIWLHAGDLAVTRATVSSQPARVHVAKPSWLGLEVSEPVSGRARLSISYTGAIEPELGRGVFQNELGADAYIYTQFEGRWARNAFPCFDEPGFKVPWTLTLRVPEGQVAAANTRVDREEHVAGRHVIHFKTTQPLPSYLVAFAVGPFEVVDGGTAGRGATPLRALVPRGRSAEAAPLLATLPKLLDHFEEYMAIPYPDQCIAIRAVQGPSLRAWLGPARPEKEVIR